MIIYNTINFVVSPDKTFYKGTIQITWFLLKNKKNVNKFEGPLPSVPRGGGIPWHKFPSTINDVTGEVQQKLT